jgi:hypothetical protein
MISSDLHGAEEPIRWTLGWQRQDRVCDEPMHREEEGTPSSGRFGIDLAHGDQPLAVGTLTMMDQDAPGWTTSRARGSHVGLFGTCDRMLEPQEGQRFAHLVIIVP